MYLRSVRFFFLHTIRLNQRPPWQYFVLGCPPPRPSLFSAAPHRSLGALGKPHQSLVNSPFQVAGCSGQFPTRVPLCSQWPVRHSITQRFPGGRLLPGYPCFLVLLPLISTGMVTFSFISSKAYWAIWRMSNVPLTATIQFCPNYTVLVTKCKLQNNPD